MAIYMFTDGVKGDVTADGYKDHISLLSFQFGVSRGISMEAGKMTNREVTRPAFSEITVTKVADSSAAAFFKEACAGSVGRKIEIKFGKTGAAKVQEFMTYTLENALVSAYSISANGEADPIESITLSFAKMLINYSNSDASNKSG